MTLRQRTDEKMPLFIEVAGSDVIQPRCGCPTLHPDGWSLGKRLKSFPDVGRSIMVAECPSCGAAWEWGEVCADRASKTAEPAPFTPEAGAYCFYVPETAYVEGRGYRASVVFENISGHIPTGTWPYEGKSGQTLPYFWGDDLKAARAYADRVNSRQFRISRKRAHAIVSHSMGLSMKADLAERAEP